MSVNLPKLPARPVARIAPAHARAPERAGMLLLAVNSALAKRGMNIERQVLDTRGDLGYAIYDVNQACDEALLQELARIQGTIRVRAAS